jgi:sigma-B regulation protein RsbU (phosphoserine phosphatase)
METKCVGMTEPLLIQQETMRSMARLRRILEATKVLNSTLDLAELTSIILKIVREEVRVDRGTVFVLDRPKEHLQSLVAQGVDGRGIVVPLGAGIAGTVAVSGKPIDIPDAYSDSRFYPKVDADLGYRTSDIYCMAITNRDGDIVGVLELLNRSRPFTDDDFEFLSGVSVHIGLALENAWLHREILEKRRIEQELSLAREIQRNFYPNMPESYGGVEISASNVMCEAVGGDYLGYFALPDGRFIVMLGDVSGKGIGAALVMTSLHATCRALVRHVHALERVADILNETLVDTTNPGTFVTLLVMLVDPISGKLHYIRAGHNPPLLVTALGEIHTLSDGGGPPVGLFSHLRLKREICEVGPGTIVVIYTDGVTEAENPEGEQFGVDRLEETVVHHHKESAVDMHQAILKSLARFTRDQPANDDTTLIVLKM